MRLTDYSLEVYVIGAALAEREAALFLLSQLSPEHFGNSAHQVIWRVLDNMYKDIKDAHIDTVTLIAKLSDLGLIPNIISHDEIENLQAIPVPDDRLVAYIEELRARTVPRMTLTLLDAIKIGAINGESPAVVIGQLQTAVGRIVQAYYNDEELWQRQEKITALEQQLNELMFCENPEAKKPFITGLPEVDVHLRYVHHSLTLVLADTGQGKSTFATQIAINTALHYLAYDLDTQVFYVTLEDSPLAVYMRSLSLLSGVPNNLLDVGKGFELRDTPYEVALKKAKQTWASLPIVVTDKIRTIGGILGVLRKAHMVGKRVGLCVIDHIQQLQPDRGYNGDIGERFYSEAMANLKTLSEETDTRIVCTSQVSKNIEGQVYAMRARGIDQAARLILMLKGCDTEHTEITCLKNSWGPRGWTVRAVNDLGKCRLCTDMGAIAGLPR